MTEPTAEEGRLLAALKRFGWEGGPEFWRRYYSDPWVFNLANAVDRLTTENEQLRSLLGDAANALVAYYDDESYAEERIIWRIEAALDSGESKAKGLPCGCLAPIEVRPNVGRRCTLCGASDYGEGEST